MYDVLALSQSSFIKLIGDGRLWRDVYLKYILELKVTNSTCFYTLNITAINKNKKYKL